MKGESQKTKETMNKWVSTSMRRKGRTKEAAGDLTGDDKLKREGKVDRAVSSVKDKVG